MTDPAPVPLKDRFTSLDTLALVHELRSLPKSRIDKVFDGAAGGWVVALRTSGEGRRDLLLVPGAYGALLPAGVPHTEELSPFARELRRLLTGASISSVAEPKGERTLEVELRRGDVPEPLTLSAELFGQGNLVVARGTRVVAVLHPRTWAHRTLRVGSEFQRPPSRANPFELTPSEIASALEGSRKDRTTTIAARLALGGPLAEELLHRVKVPGDAAAPSEAGRVAGELHAALRALLDEVGDRPRGYLYLREDVPVDAEPFRSQRWDSVGGTRVEEFPTFSEAAYRFFGSVRPVESLPTEEITAHTAELERQRDRQAAAVDALAAEAARLNRLAETVLTHYAESEAALAGSEGSSGTVEVTVAGEKVPLLVGRSVRESAQRLFEEGKRAQAKLAGATSALAETVRRLAEERPAKAVDAAPRTGGRSAKPFWFERYRWFITSEGAVVIGGRDATSNDLIVRRYLKPGDRYVHADIHGAPSVIVKHPEPGAAALTDASLVEAGQWGVAFSKAWRAGLASASAFWVEADQVSKAGASGEFVPRGAWVIHGTKNFLKDLPTELAVGTVDYEGRELWVVAPPSAFRARGRVRVRLVPGEERERAEREVELARELGLSRSRLQGMLPAGGIAIRRV